jgi:TatD DNase family protein
VTDNHAHLEPEQRVAEKPLTLDQHIASAAAAGVSRLVQCGCDLEAARWTVKVAVQRPEVVGAIAIHPNEAALLAGHPQNGAPIDHQLDGIGHLENPSTYREAFTELAEMVRSEERIRAVGETGLDYFRTGPEGHAAQLEAFRDHIALAKELDRALQIHDRDAHQDVIDTLLADGAPKRTVFHCYSGDREMARIAAQHGWYCSFAGTVTFKPSEELRLAVSELPKHLILVETDSPYLTPQPFRGRPNAPYMVALTMATLAERMGLDLETACLQVQTNTTNVYGNW